MRGSILAIAFCATGQAPAQASIQERIESFHDAVLVPAGKFWMSELDCEGHADEHPRHDARPNLRVCAWSVSVES